MSRNGSNQSLKDRILSVIGSRPAMGFRRAEIRRFLGNVDEAYFKEVFKSLVASGELVKAHRGRYQCAEALSLKRGIIHINAKGFGFVHFDDGTRDAFIPAEETLGALSGDTVLVRLNDDDDPRGPSGSIRQIVIREHENFVGCLGFGQDGYVIRPLRRELPSILPLVCEYGHDVTGGASEGDWVQARLVPGRHPNSPMSAEVVKRISASGSVVGDLNAIVKEYGLPKRYTLSDERGLERIIPIDVPREDLRQLTTVTIDPIDAKDFDDAISISPGNQSGQVVIGVHIADVACFVPPDSPLDLEARQRGFTNYLPGRTITMLPSLLSTELCCLRENEERNAHSVMLTIDKMSGEVVSARRIHSIIKVTKQLTFEEAARVIAGETGAPDLPEEIVQLLLNLNSCAVAMRNRRRTQEQFLPLAVPEYHVLIGGRPMQVQGIAKKEPSSATELIEELMLAANVAVAQEMLNRNIPALFRNHAEPDPQALEDFTALTQGVLGRKNMPSFAKRDSINGFLQKLNTGRPSDELLSMAFLRCLPRAQYAAECQGHYGLGKPIYCHFTSPIRRYPDLLVHQQLLAGDLGQEPRSLEFMQDQAISVNELENNGDQASFAALDRMKLRFLEQKKKETTGSVLEAFVLRVTSDHLSLFLPEFGLMGMMDVKELGDERWQFNSRTASLTNRNGKNFKCGNVIYVQIRTIDAIHGELLLKPAL
ncbi:MAG: VacB/RNase II family 3'-5' exoribonuclease [Victivallales bacterium]|nr:VacB/RNase II family 3'-5' exoribonuclease [Victivallales bacterium]